MNKQLPLLLASAGLAALVSVPASSAVAQQAPEVESVMTETAGAISVRRVAGGLNHPWAIAFLPDGRALITERAGDLRILQTDGTLSEPVKGTPQVWAQGQGGLLDVALDPNFQENRYVYLSYAKPGPDTKATTALGRGKLVDGTIEGFEDIFVEQPYINGPNHFGNRIVFRPDGTLFLALGERFQFDPAQDLSTHLGKVVRINPDGSVPKDNPFVDKQDVLPEIWSYGHRNIEAAALDPETNQLWIAEMGPLGGDELNQPEAGTNYGWPVVSWGAHYDGRPIPNPPTRPEFADAVRHWSPVISPSGMVYYTGDVWPEWQGSFFIGGLSSQQVVRVKVEDGQVVEEERIPLPARIREVDQGPDGRLWVLTDKRDGEVWRIEPLE